MPTKSIMMKTKTAIWIGVLVVLVVIQFFQPPKRTADEDAPNDIAAKYDVPMNTLMNLYDGCYNCHSDFTKYPWYYQVQPIGWWMAHHISEARRHLNFSQFGTYTAVQARKKFHAIHKVMVSRSMPLKSYLLMHEEAHLTPGQYQNVADWAQKMENSMDSATAGSRD